MTWKEFPYWLKSGIVFLILDILLILFISITSHPWEAILLGFSFTQIPIAWIYLSLTGVSSVNGLIVFGILGLINWFLIGALIGLIVNKIKS